MAIDSSIYGLIKPQQAPTDPITEYGKVLSLKTMMGQQGLQDLQTRKLTRDIEDDDSLRSLLRGKPNATVEEVTAINPEFGLKFGKSRLEAEKLKGDVETNRLTNYARAAEQMRDVVAAAKSDADMPRVRDAAVRLFGPEVAAQMNIPQVFDPAWQQQTVMTGTALLERMKPHMQVANLGGRSTLVETNPNAQGFKPDVDLTHTATPGDLLTDARGKTTATETARHNRELEARAAEQAGRDRTQVVTDTNGNITLVNKDSGTSRPALDANGQPLLGKNNMTEAQGKAGGMAIRAREAESILEKLEKGGTLNRSIIKQGVETIPVVGGGLAIGANYMASSPQQQVEQARRNFVNAVLRVESGASISDGEFRNAERQYFPMPGDSKQTIAQKRDNRRTAIQALEMQSGPAHRPAPQPAPSPNPANNSVRGIKFLGMEPG